MVLRMTKKITTIGLVAIGVMVWWMIAFPTTPVHYKCPEISSVVIDSFTGKPVENATVAIRWSALRPRDWHGSHIMDIHAVTVTTGKDGRFVVPAWGPVTTDRAWRLYDWDPDVSVTKNGCKPADESNTYNQENVTRNTPVWGNVTLKVPSWVEQGIELERMENDTEVLAATNEVMDGTGAASNTLEVFAIYKHKVQKGYFVDAPDFPKLGYIHSEPDLVITNLLSITRNTKSTHLYNQETGYEGESKVELLVMLPPAYAKGLARLVRKYVRKHNLVIVSGKKPLGEVYLTMYAMSPDDFTVPSGSHPLSLPVRSHQDVQSMEDDLKKLVKP